MKLWGALQAGTILAPVVILERAAILEYDAGYTRVEAERLAREMVNPQPKKQKQEKLWTYI